jgi:hypothetical protein
MTIQCGRPESSGLPIRSFLSCGAVVALLQALLWAAASTAAIEIPLVEPDYFSEEDVPLAGGPKVARHGDVISATFCNGCVLTFDIAQNTLNVANPAGVTILANNPGQILQLKYIPAGMGPGIQPSAPRTTFRFRRLTSFGEALMLRFAVAGEDGLESALDWSFQPLRRKINGVVFDGIGDAFTITDPHHYLHEVTLSGLAATGADFVGARTLRLACFGPSAGPAELTFGATRHDLGWWGAFIDGGQFFHVVGQRQGTLYEYLDDECHDMTDIRSNGPNNAVEIAHTLLLGRVPSLYQTPLRVRLFTQRELTPQLWLELVRSRRLAFRAKYQIPATPQRPILMARNFWYKTPFADFAGNLTPVREMGWRRLEIGWVYHRGWAPAVGHAWPAGALYDDQGKVVAYPTRQSEYKDRLLENYGGVPALRDFVGRAHQEGIEVYFWHQTAHGWLGSDDVRNHPDWVVHDYHGVPVAGAYAESLVWFDLRSGFRDATIERIRRIKEQTGVDGFWLDMYGSGLHNTPNYINLVASPTVTERMDYLRRLREMGLGLYAEGVSSVLIDSYVLWNTPNWQGKEFILYGSSPYLWERRKFDQLDLFKLMSYQCFPTDTLALLSPPQDEATRQWIEATKYRNRCFNLIEDTLGQPVGVVTNPVGTQWVHDHGNVLFFHAGADVEVPLPRPLASTLAIGPAGEVPVALPGERLRAALPAQSILILKFR